MVWNADGSIAVALGADTSAQAINGVDRIVGFTGAFTGADRAAIWNGANVADTRNLSDVFSQAYGINDSSHVVGVAGTGAFVAVPQP